MKKTIRTLFSVTLSILMLLSVLPAAELTAKADAVGDIYLEATEIKDGKFKVVTYAENYADLLNFDYVLTYDSDAVCLASRVNNPANGTGDFSQLGTDVVMDAAMSGYLFSAYNAGMAGEIKIAFSFSHPLGTNAKTPLFTTEFEFKNNTVQEATFTLSARNGSEIDTLTVEQCGDADGDGFVTAYDARLILRCSVGLELLSDSSHTAADTDKNGDITAADARLALRASVGLEMIGTPSAFKMPLDPDAEASGKIRFEATEIADGKIKIKDIADNFYDFQAANWKLSYNPAVLTLSAPSKPLNNPENGTGDLTQIGTDTVALAAMGGNLMTAYNTNSNGKIFIGFAFKECLNTNEKSVLFTTDFEIADNTVKKTTLTLTRNDGAVEDSIDIIIHNHSYLVSVTTDATCKDPGMMTYTCSCGDTYTVEIPMLTTHTYISSVTAEPTCKDAGVMTYTCEVCSDSYTQEIPVTDTHIFGEWIVTVSPTYESTGSEERACIVCDTKETKEIAKLEYTEIVLPENEDVTVADKETVISAPEITVEALISKTHGNVTIKDKDGNSVKNSDTLKSGMVITLTDDNNIVIDTKTVIVPGDNNGDGEITASDARNALRASVELENLNSWQKTASDLNEKEKNEITAADARFILRASVGLEDLKSWIGSAV